MMTALFAKTALLPDDWAFNVRVTIDPDGQISTVEKETTPQANDTLLANGLLLPAPGNLHSHAFQRALAGLTENRNGGEHDSFWTWRQLMYKFLEVLTPEHVQAITELSQVEMMESGYASVAEFHYLHHQHEGQLYDDPVELSSRIIEASVETGTGLTLLPVYYSQGGVDGRALQGGQLRFKNNLDQFSNIWTGARKALENQAQDFNIGIAPHSLRAVSKTELLKLEEAYGQGPIHIHIAEQIAEIDEIEAAYGQRPISWLIDNVNIDKKWCLIHATHMTHEEVRSLASSDAVAGLCPVTEANLGDGIFPAHDFLSQGGSMGLGTDSNIAIDLAQEMRMLEYSQRLKHQSRSVLCDQEKSTGRYIFDHICKGGAQALGRQSGSIAPGSWADLMTLDGDALPLVGLKDDMLLDAWVFASGEQLVQDVWSAGRHMIKEGRHINRPLIENKYRKAMKELRALL